MLAKGLLSGTAVAAFAAALSFWTMNSDAGASSAATTLTSVAVRVHNMDRMVAFYSSAFGATFRDVDARGIRSKFGEAGGVLLKFVPIRDRADFENFPLHQLGFEVADVTRVIALAVEHGGRQEGDVTTDGGRVHAAIRDPDGNTIELYGKR